MSLRRVGTLVCPFGVGCVSHRAATMEDVTEGPQEIKHRITMRPSNSTSGYLYERQAGTPANVCTATLRAELFTESKVEANPSAHRWVSA